MNLVFLNEAMEKCRATDTEAFKAKMKSLRCSIELGGIIKVDLDRLNAILDDEFTKAAEAAAKPKTKPHREGSDLGLILARLALNPQRIEAKKQRVKGVEAKLAAASTPYDRHKHKRELDTLNTELQRLFDGQARDEKRRDEILNGDVQ